MQAPSDDVWNGFYIEIEYGIPQTPRAITYRDNLDRIASEQITQGTGYIPVLFPLLPEYQSEVVAEQADANYHIYNSGNFIDLDLSLYNY